MDMDQTLAHQFDRRRLLTRALQVGGLAAVGGPLLAACGSSSSGGTAVTPTGSATGGAAPADFGALKYQLSWVPDVEFAGSYIADTKGYYSKAGFSSVDLIGGGPTATPAETVVVTGKALVATSSPDATAAAISKGAPLKIIAAQYQKSPFCIMSLAKSPIKTPSDMYGKKIGVQADNENVWAAFLKANNLDASKINKVPVQFDPTPLTTNTVDGWFSFITNEPIELKEKGFATYTFLLADWHYPLIGNSYCVTNDSISSKRDELKAFLKAEIEGWKASIADPSTGAQLATDKYGKSLKLDLNAEKLQSTAQNALITVGVSSTGILLLTPDVMDESVKTLEIGGTTLTTDQLFDMSLMTEIYQENPSLV